MFGSMWNFVKRHKRKFIFVGVVAGGMCTNEKSGFTYYRPFGPFQLCDIAENLNRRKSLFVQ